MSLTDEDVKNLKKMDKAMKEAKNGSDKTVNGAVNGAKKKGVLMSAISSAYGDYKKKKKKEKEIYKESFMRARERALKRKGFQEGTASVMKPPLAMQAFGPGSNNFNPFGSMFDTGMSRPRAKKSTAKKQKQKYAVVGGKAYPIVQPSGGMKRKKSSKKRSTGGFGNWDPIDNSGWL